MLTGILILWPMLAALASYLLGRKSKSARNGFVCIAAVLEFAASVAALTLYARQENPILSVPLCGMGLTFRMDGFRLVYTAVAAFLWAVTACFSPDYLAHYRNRNRYYFFFLLTLGATVGVFLSQDLFTTLVFFEIMSLASYPWVAHDETPDAMRAADTYLAVAVIGGLVMLMGLFLLYHLTGTLDFDELRAVCGGVSDRGMLWAAVLCILFGFGAKAGMFPLHIWLPKAHPIAPAPASALLSGILTKSGVFGVLVLATRILPMDRDFGHVLLVLALITMLLGAVLALFSVNLKRTLACSSMSQIGFVLFGVSMLLLLGEEGGIAARGAFLHMLNHSLIKLVLFCAAGVVYKNLHTLDLNKMKGFGRGKPLFFLLYVSGAWGIAGLPGGNGYISKTLLHESVVELQHITAQLGGNPAWYAAAEWLFLLAGGMTLAYMTKLFVVLFLEKPDKAHTYPTAKCMKPLSGVVLGISALLLPVLGCFPHAITDRIAALTDGFFCTEGMERVAYFSPENLKGAAFTVLFASVFYFGLIRPFLSENKAGRRKYPNRWPGWLDLEEKVYRPLLLKLLPGIGEGFCRGLERVLGAETWTAIGLAVGGFLARCAERSLDGTVTLLRRTLFAPVKPKAAPVGTRFTDTLGHGLDETVHLIDTATHHTVHRESYVDRLAEQHERNRREHRLVGFSMSFGLLMAVLGIGFALVYMLVRPFFAWMP